MLEYCCSIARVHIITVGGPSEVLENNPTTPFLPLPLPPPSPVTKQDLQEIKEMWNNICPLVTEQDMHELNRIWDICRNQQNKNGLMLPTKYIVDIL